MISNCGKDENGNYSGGKAGDQTKKEYCIREWYNRPWDCIIRHPDLLVGMMIADIATRAANNNHIGYDQSQRLTYYQALKAANWKPESIKKNCEADCSSSTAANIIAVGHQLALKKLQAISPSCFTGNLRKALEDAGFQVLREKKYLESDAYLLPGDILLNEKSHAAINLDKGKKASKGNH